MCKKCNQYNKTIDHITGDCELLTGTDYTTAMIPQQWSYTNNWLYNIN